MSKSTAKRVLIIAYYFPPLAMGGVQRVVKFCKYLPEYGWKPVVLTSVPRGYFALDASFSTELKETIVYEAKSILPLSIGSGKSFESWRGRLKSIIKWILTPDVRVLWFPFAVAVGFRLLRKHKIDCIFATAPPYSSLLVARLLSHRTGLPLIVDFRDAWVDDPFASFPSPLHRRLNRYLEGRVVAGADIVISINEEIISGFRRRWGDEDERYRILSQGFDPSDFEQVVERAEKFTICYTGSFIRTRRPDDLFRAVSQLIREGKLDPALVELDIVGFCPSSHVRSAKRMGLEDIVQFRGYLHHASSVRHLLRADLLWLYIAQCEGNTILTGKLFEYLGSGKPIVASVPESGAAASIIRDLEAGLVVRPGEVESLKGAILEHYERWVRGEQPSGPSASLSRYDRRLLAGELAGLLDSLSPAARRP